MELFCTEIQAIDPIDGNMKFWRGPNIKAISFKDAERYCQLNGLGYCKVIGIVESEIDWNADNSLTTKYDRLHKEN